MAIELQHLHPGHDDELSRLKARIAELEKENGELRSKNEGLLYALADAETDVAMSQRWRKYSHDWYLRHKAEHNEKCREWARNNREKSRKQSRRYYWAHKDERNAASKKWRDEHKEIYNARMRAYRKRQKKQKQAQKP